MGPGFTPTAHKHASAVDLAVQWLIATPGQDRPRPVVPFLRQRFGLTPLQAIDAIRLAEAKRRQTRQPENG